MSDLLKGNYKTAKSVKAASDEEDTLEDRFEREAMQKLGGSIAFVSKKKVNWGAKDKE